MHSYRIERLIGIGGEAVVYEARPLLPDGDGPPVACKVIREQRRSMPRECALARQEAALGLRITPGHRGLVEVRDCFQDTAERLCMVMELVDGVSLKALHAAARRLPFPIVRRVLREVLEALVYLHGLGVLHRDLSLCNVLISTSGTVKVADLGIARVMEDGQFYTRTYRGKVVYGSYEALQTLTLDVRSDLYTLAAVLQELLGGTPPCGDTDALAQIVIRQLREDFAPLPPDTPADLAELARGLIRSDRDERQPQSAIEALALLRRHGQPVASRAELAALVTAMKAQRGEEPEGAHRVALLEPGELLAPGYVLIARTVLEPIELLPASAPAQPPVPPMPAEPPPPLLQPPRRITAQFPGPAPDSSASPVVGLDVGADASEQASDDLIRIRLRPRPRAGAAIRVAGVAMTAACLLALVLLLADGLRGAHEPIERQQPTLEPAPVAEPVAPAPIWRETSEVRERTATTPEQPRVVERARDPHRKRIEMQRESRRTDAASIRRPEPLGGEPPSWATP